MLSSSTCVGSPLSPPDRGLSNGPFMPLPDPLFDPLLNGGYSVVLTCPRSVVPGPPPLSLAMMRILRRRYASSHRTGNATSDPHKVRLDEVRVDRELARVLEAATARAPAVAAVPHR